MSEAALTTRRDTATASRDIPGPTSGEPETSVHAAALPQKGFYATAPAMGLGSPVRKKLVAGGSGDPQERAADIAADHVVSGRTPPVVPRAPAAGAIKLATLPSSPRKDEEAKGALPAAPNVIRHAVEPKRTDAVETTATPVNEAAEHAVRHGGVGEPMKPRTRQILETRMGASLQNVRVHNDSSAHTAAAAMEARAFAHGSHIWLGRGQSQDDLHLMAHETAHVMESDPTVVRRKSVNDAASPGAAIAPTSDPQPTVAKAVLPKTQSTAGAPPIGGASASSGVNGGAGASNAGSISNGDAAINVPPVESASSSGDTKILMPEPAAGLSEDDKTRLTLTQQNASQAATINAAMPPANSAVAEARAAVTEPTAEAQAKARAQLIDALGERPAPSPEIEELCTRIHAAISDRRPADKESLVRKDPAAVAKEVGGSFNQSIQSGADKVQQGYSDLDAKPKGEAPAPGESIQPQPAAVETPEIGAASAAPTPVPADNVSLQPDVAANQARIDSAGMNTEPAKLVQEGPIADVRNAQGELAAVAERDPAAVLADQQAAINKAGGEMASLQAQALNALTSTRSSTVISVESRKKGMVPTEEEMRTSAGSRAKAIFDAAQTKVEALLTPLPSTAMDRWQAGVDQASGQFKGRLKKVEDWLKERYSGGWGAVVEFGDDIVGKPDWVDDEYAAAEQQFADTICELIRSISSDVNTIVATCEKIIADARKEKDAVFDALPASLKDWAEQQKTHFDEQLNGLHDRAVKARDQFNHDLVDKAANAVQDVREKIQGLRESAKGLLQKAQDAIDEFAADPARFIINGLLKIVNIPPDAFWALVDKISTVIDEIAAEPLKFANNLMAAVGQGFSQFFDNIGTHLLEGLLQWLFSAMDDVGVTLPKDLSLPSVITFFLQVMGITWPRVRKLLVKHVGEKNVAMVEKAWSIIAPLIEKGPAGVWEMIKDKLNPKNILDMILNAAKDALVTALIKQAAIKIATLLVPGGAIVEALKDIYEVLKWIFKNAAKIFRLVETIVNGIHDIFTGNISGMAKAVEKALAMMIPPVIDFLAEILGLDDIPSKIASTVKDLQAWVEETLDTVIGWLVEQGKKLLGIGGDEKKKESPDDITETKPFMMTSHSHTLTATVHEGRVKITMASDEPLDLKVALANAIRTVEKTRDPRPEDYDLLEDQLRAISDALNTADGEIAEDWKASGASDPSGGKKTVDLQAFIDARLGILSNMLYALAQKHHLADLNDFFAGIPEKRYLPPGYDVRGRLYYAGSKWTKGWYDGYVRSHLTEIRDRLRAAVKGKDQDAISKLSDDLQLPSGLTPATVRIDDITAEKYDIDHERSLSEHWQLHSGNDTSDSVRRDETTRDGNLRLILSGPNRSKGSKVDDGDVEYASWIKWVGSNFVSERAMNGHPKATTIDGQPFLKGPNGPPIITTTTKES